LTVVLATIATIFLLMPGFTFIAGVNITDKNIREIVFRGTPAELAYVVTVSLIVHWIFTLPYIAPIGPGQLLERGIAWYHAADGNAQSPPHELSLIVSAALRYFIVSALVGGGFGIALGLAVAKWHFRIFIKHRWMVEFIGARKGNAVYARVLMTPEYSAGKEAGDAAIFVEGTIRDCFFAADGTLLYLAFTDFKTKSVRLDAFSFNTDTANTGTAGNEEASRTDLPATASVGDGRLILEGRHVAMVRYEPIPARGVSSQADLDRIKRAS
jgi:hypothetical protein